MYVIDQWIDARALGRAEAVHRTQDAVRGLATGQVAEVVVADPDSAAEIAQSSESRLLELLEASHLDPDTFRLIIRHR